MLRTKEERLTETERVKRKRIARAKMYGLIHPDEAIKPDWYNKGKPTGTYRKTPPMGSPRLKAHPQSKKDTKARRRRGSAYLWCQPKKRQKFLEQKIECEILEEHPCHQAER